MEKVVSLSNVRSLDAQRALALFGPCPMFTFHADEGDNEVCCCVRLVPGSDDTWLGLVPDKALFTDRLRMGMSPRFVVHHNADTPTLSGTADVRVLGRVGPDAGLPSEVTLGTADAVRTLLETTPFPPRDALVVEVRPANVRIDEGEAPAHGAIPRT